MSSSKISKIGSATVSRQGGGASGGKRRRRLSKNKRRDPLMMDDPDKKHFKVTDTVLKSEEKLRALYEEWSLKMKPDRTEEDKEERFKYFKDSAKLVRELNKKHPTGGYGLNCFADRSPQERERSRSGIIGIKQSDRSVKDLELSDSSVEDLEL